MVARVRKQRGEALLYGESIIPCARHRSQTRRAGEDFRVPGITGIALPRSKDLNSLTHQVGYLRC